MAIAAPAAAHAARPTACFTQSPADAVAGEPVTFDSGCSHDAGDKDDEEEEAGIVRRAWDTDADGSYDDRGNEQVITVVYSAPGTYRIGLAVTDTEDDVDTEVKTVTVRAPPPPPEPAAPPALPAAPQSPRLLDPFPTVRIRGRTTTRGVALTLLSVRAPTGATVRLRCSGKRCPRKLMTGRVKGSSSAGYVRFRRVERTLHAGTVLRLYVTQDGMIGKYTRFRIRRLALPARSDRCLMPGSARPVACP